MVLGLAGYLTIIGILILTFQIPPDFSLSLVSKSLYMFIPLLLRICLIINYSEIMQEKLGDEEKATDSEQMLSLTMCGFAISALFLILVTNPTFVEKGINANLSLLFIMISAGAFLVSNSIESYKNDRSIQNLSYGFDDVGRLALLASLIALLWESKFDLALKCFALLLCTLIYGWDIYRRINLSIQYLESMKEMKKNDNF